MTLLPPILFLFDTSALLVGSSRDWQEFAQIGECYVSEGVLEAMEFMCDRASELDHEGAAREFLRFYPAQGWKRTNVLADHPSLKATPGHALSKRARLVLEVLENAYGMALRYPTSLIVLVSTEQSVLQKIPPLEKANLCGLPLAALVQWSRSQRRPPVITHHVQLMRATANKGNGKAPVGRISDGGTGRKSATPGLIDSRTAATRSTAAPVEGWAATKSRRGRFGWGLKLSRLFTNLISLVVLLGAIALLWRFLSPASFNQLWQQLPIVGRPK